MSEPRVNWSRRHLRPMNSATPSSVLQRAKYLQKRDWLFSTFPRPCTEVAVEDVLGVTGSEEDSAGGAIPSRLEKMWLARMLV